MYQRTPHYVWIDWEADEQHVGEADFSGFRMRTLRNPTAAEVRAEHQAFMSYLKQETTVEEYYPVIAPRVIEWECENDGERVPAPGEAEGNAAAFLLLEPELAGWVIRTVRNIHLPKRTTQPSPPAGTTAMSTPTETSPMEAMPPVA
jgi:hypothetical protein